MRMFNSGIVQTLASVNLATTGAGASFDISNAENASYQVALASGTFGTAVISFQGSNDNSTFYEIASSTLSGGIGFVTGVSVNSIRYLRINVSTAAGSAGSADITVFAK